MAEKKYRNAYTEHCIRHPNDHVNYTAFRWRMRNRGEKLAIRLGKQESAPKTAEKVAKKRAERLEKHLIQKEAWEKREKNNLIKRVVLGAVLFGLGVALGLAL